MFVALKPYLDDYHQRRANKHGYIYIVNRKYGPLYEARSIATGVLCTLDKRFLEEVIHAVQEPET